MNGDLSQSRLAGNRVIAGHAKSQVQTFFDEIKNGTQNYRTVASLDAQIAQEYRGRCVLELLQNAHDALAESKPEDPGRISFVLKTSPEPVLLIGNTGRPFRLEDFKGVCQLAQSPKDPNESVGNKGLGFRSVLEVSGCPEIWSTTPVGSDMCFSFRFDPNVIDQVAAAAQDLGRCGLDVRSLFDTSGSLVDWSPEQLDQFRQFVAEREIDVPREAKFLSPYQLPLPVEEMPSDVKHLLDMGHATVVRLRLDGGRMLASEDAVQSVRKQLDDLREARSVVFLDHLAELVIEVEGDRHSLMRTVHLDTRLAGHQRINQRRLRIQIAETSPDNTGLHHFRVWTRVFGGDDDPSGKERICSAVKHLPNRWPEVRQATVGIAVEDTPEQVEGVFVIFLPTEKVTGTGAHVNAPFYGSLDRRQIDFNEAYNELILDSVLDLCLDAASELTGGRAEAWRARAVLDILSSNGNVGGEQWSLLSKLRERAEEQDKPLGDQAIILCDDGWHTPGEARLMPDISDDDPIGVGRWRKHAEFSIVSKVLDGRRVAVTELLEGLGGSVDPTHQEWVSTIERMARQIREGELNITWDDFLCSLLEVLPDGLRDKPRSVSADPLAEARFLPASDGRLIAASSSTRLFFPPVQGVDDTAEPIQDVPQALRERLAFLHPDVRTHEGKVRTNVQQFLDGRFVKTYRGEDLLRDVVIPALPSLPILHGSPEAEHWAEILKWAISLFGDKPPNTLRQLLQKLPVCCHGGWLPMSEAVFGLGWPDRHGDDIEILADELSNGAALRLKKMILLPPSDERWLIDVESWGKFFTHIGVVDGLRLRAVDITFTMGKHHSELPQKLPSGDTPSEAWMDWYNAVKGEIKPYYAGQFEYKLSGVQLLSEIHHLVGPTQSGRRALSNLLLCSIGRWNAGWESVTVTKVDGNPWRKSATSPLKHWLRRMAWLSDRDNIAEPLSRRWLVPESLLRGQSERYAHLDPLPLDLARKLSAESTLRDRLVMFGLNVYPTEDDQTGPELLEALARAWANDRVPSGRFDVFLGQVREAWRHLDLDKGFPDTFLVRNGKRSFSTHGLDEMADVFLPDNRDRAGALRAYGKGILEMEVKDANRVADALVAVAEVNRASQLKEEHTIDGAPWSGQAAGTVPLDASKYKWLPVILLSVAAHGGTNPAGATTTAWRNAADRLRRTSVIECNEIGTKIVHEDHFVAENEPRSQWLPGDVLAIRRDLKSHEDLAFAAQAMLNRQDISKDLRLVLGSLPIEDVTPKHIEAALERAEIDASAFADIRQRWTGNMSMIVDRVRPVLKLLDISEHGFDAAAADIGRLTEWLSANLPDWPAPELLSVARRSHDDHAMGTAAWHTLGEVAQLPAWNAVLAELEDRYETVGNRRVVEQTQAHLEEAMPLLRGFARYVALSENDPALFRLIERVTQDFDGDADWSTQWWEVPFVAVLNALIDRYEEIAELTPYVKLIEGSETAEHLRHRLEKAGIEIATDPYEMADRNRRRLVQVLSALRDLHRAWIKFSGSGRSGKGEPELPELLGELDGTEYLDDWSDKKLLALALQELDDDSKFIHACAGCSTLDEIRHQLNLTPQAIKKRRQERFAREREVIRRRRIHLVAGQSFEVGTSYSGLFDRLSGLAVPAGPCASKDEFTVLANVRKRGGSTGGRGLGGSPPPRPSADLTELVGVAGEIWAYRYLRSSFGEEVVTRKCWVSEIRRIVLPPVEDEPNDISDSHGFDFRFKYRRSRWHVEVKATAGEDSQFDIGISEIEAATRLAQSGSGRWRILRVRNALSKQPEFDWLPNPFEDKFKEYFRLHQGGMRVSYSRQ